MSHKMTFTRNLIGFEDLLLGTGVVNQVRGQNIVPLTKINASIIPYDSNNTLKDKIDSLDTTHYVDSDNLPVYIATPHSDTNLNLNDVIWIKTISSTERHVYYYDKLMFKYNPTSGNLILDPEVFQTSVDAITDAYEAADTALFNSLTSSIATETTARLALGNALTLAYTAADVALVAALQLGTASEKYFGVEPYNLVELDGMARLPAIDGSQLLNLPIATMPSGAIVQRTFDRNDAVTAYSNFIPRDGVPPPNTAGTEVLSRTITPKGIGNKLLIRFQGNSHNNSVGVAGAALLFVNGVFKDGTYSRSANNSSTVPLTLTLEYEITAASLDPITISIRVGPAFVAGSINLNDNSWGVNGKGASLVIEEMKV